MICHLDGVALSAFSPLIIGEWTATRDEQARWLEERAAFSPLIIGEWTATSSENSPRTKSMTFQSPNHRGVDCNPPRP